MLRTLAFRNPSSWSEQLPWVDYAHNFLPSSATGLSPFQSCLGYQQPLFSSQETEVSVPLVQAFIRCFHHSWRTVRAALCQNREYTRCTDNRRRVKAPRYICGQKVWLSTQDLPMPCTFRKLAPHFIGPFPIVKVLSPAAIKLKLPPNLRRVHPVFHISCVKHLPDPPTVLFLSRVLLFTGLGDCWTCAARGVVISI